MKLTKEMLIDWIDRSPSNTDFKIITYIINLQNNRDKAIEQCNDWIKIYKKLNSDERLILRLEEISRTLKGDSE